MFDKILRFLGILFAIFIGLGVLGAIFGSEDDEVTDKGSKIAASGPAEPAEPEPEPKPVDNQPTSLDRIFEIARTDGRNQDVFLVSVRGIDLIRPLDPETNRYEIAYLKDVPTTAMKKARIDHFAYFIPQSGGRLIDYSYIDTESPFCGFLPVRNGIDKIYTFNKKGIPAYRLETIVDDYCYYYDVNPLTCRVGRCTQRKAPGGDEPNYIAIGWDNAQKLHYALP